MQTNILTSLCICRFSCGKYFIKLETNTHILIFQYLTFYILHSTFITCILRTLEDNTLDINLLDCFHSPRLPKSKFVNQYIFMGFPGGSAVKKIHLPMQETWVWSLDQEDPLEEEMACSCLENPMDRGAWQATVHGVAKSRTQLSTFTSGNIPTHLATWHEQNIPQPSSRFHSQYVMWPVLRPPAIMSEFYHQSSRGIK